MEGIERQDISVWQCVQACVHHTRQDKHRDKKRSAVVTYTHTVAGLRVASRSKACWCCRCSVSSSWQYCWYKVDAIVWCSAPCG